MSPKIIYKYTKQIPNMSINKLLSMGEKNDTGCERLKYVFYFDDYGSIVLNVSGVILAVSLSQEIHPKLLCFPFQ